MSNRCVHALLTRLGISVGKYASEKTAMTLFAFISASCYSSRTSRHFVVKISSLFVGQVLLSSYW